MKKIIALFFFCSTTFLMGMEKNTDNVLSKLMVEYKEIDEINFVDGALGNLYAKYGYLYLVFSKALGSSPQNVVESHPIYKKFWDDLEFVSSNRISNEDYKNLDTTLKFVSNASKSIYKELQEKKEKYSIKLNPPKGYFRYYDWIRPFEQFASFTFLALGAFGLSIKILGEKDILSSKSIILSKKFAFLMGIGLISGVGRAAIVDKIFSPYTKRCETYEKKKKEKERCEKLKSYACETYKWANFQARFLKPIFTKHIRKKENDKLNLLDVKIKTLH